MKKLMKQRAVALLFAVSSVTACNSGGADDPTTEELVASIAFTPGSPTTLTSIGDQALVRAFPRSLNNQTLRAPLTWSVSTPGIVDIAGSDTGAVLLAVHNGTTTVTAKSGSVSNSFDITVQQVVTSVEIAAPAATVIPGSTLQLVAIARDSRHNVIPSATNFTFISSDSASIRVSNTGLVTGLFNPFRVVQNVTIIATYVQNGFAISGPFQIGLGGRLAPLRFEYAALMLTDYEKPTAIPLLGQGVIYFTDNGNSISYKLLWSALSGPPTSAHIHGPGGSSDISDVVVDLPLNGNPDTFGTLSGSFNAADIHPQAGRASISLDSLRTLLGNAQAYIDLHTTRFGGGEIRGQSNRFFVNDAALRH